jgi:peptide/nickel transport system substrate-binding protein
VTRYSLTIVTLGVLAACSDTSTQSPPRGGTAIIATTSDADNLFPPLVGSTTARQVTELVYDYLTEVSPSLDTYNDKTFATRLAKSWEWSADSLSLAVHLHADARWHDGKPVTSGDVAYTYSIYTDSTLGSSMASQLSSIDSVTTSDSLTAVFWFNKRYPLQFYDATSQMQIVPRHVFGAIRPDSLRTAVSAIKPTGSGRYRFVNWKSNESIELAADSSNYRGPAKIERLIWKIFQSPDMAARAVLSGEADVYDAMRPENVKASENNQNVKVLISPGADYAFMTFNLVRPLFQSRDLRRALTMALDRASMTRNVFDSLARPAIGPTLSSFPSTDRNLEQIPYDPRAAARILDSLGWRLDSASKIRKKDGRELRFKVMIPTSSANRVRMGILAQEQLRKAGVAIDLDQMDYNAFSVRLGARNFETAMHSWHLGTSPASIREIWTSEAAAKGGINYGQYRSAIFDAYVDSAVNTSDPARSMNFYNRAYQTAIDDAPAVWIYEPKLVLGVNSRIHTQPYRPDAWWFSLGEWYIPTSELIARDRVR